MNHIGTPKAVSGPLRFDDVLVADGMAWTLFSFAQKEGLLYTAPGTDPPNSTPKERNRQALLSLIVLFDKLIVHDLNEKSEGFRIPDLERDGILEIVTTLEPSSMPAPLKSSWQPSKFDPRSSPPVHIRRDLALVQAYKPLIIDRLMSVQVEYDSFVAQALRIPRRAYYNDFLDFAVAYIVGDNETLRNSIIEQSLPRKLLKEIKSELFDFQKHGDRLSPTNATAVMMLVFANELGAIREISAARKLGVATQHYSGAVKIHSKTGDGFTVDPSQAAKSFGLFRSILHEEGHFFPEIKNISHALKLRRNPHLLAFKEQFREFHVQLARGDRAALSEVRQEIKRAKRALERTRKWNLALRWLTYISLPVGIAESLLTGPPIAGTSLAVMSAAGTAINARASRKSEWVLFGM